MFFYCFKVVQDFIGLEFEKKKRLISFAFYQKVR